MLSHQWTMGPCRCWMSATKDCLPGIRLTFFWISCTMSVSRSPLLTSVVAPRKSLSPLTTSILWFVGSLHLSCHCLICFDHIFQVKSPCDFIVKRYIEGEPEYIYTHSYLGNGLMSARKSILLKNFTKSLDLSDYTCGPGGNQLDYCIASPCFKLLGNQTDIWKFSGNIFHITSDNSVKDSFEECYIDAQRFVANSNIDKSEELLYRNIYAMGYFYDRMKDIRVVKKEQGYVKVRDFFTYAENICTGVIKVRKQSSFLCLDLLYIFSYLHHGLGLALHKDILVTTLALILIFN